MARSNTPQLIAGVLVLFGIIHYFRGRDLSANADNAEDNLSKIDNPPPLLDGSNGGGGNESGQDTPAPSPQNYDITYNNDIQSERKAEQTHALQSRHLQVNHNQEIHSAAYPCRQTIAAHEIIFHNYAIH